MISNFCGNCGNIISGSFCGECGNAVRVSKNNQHIMDRDTGVNENLDQNNRTQLLSVPELLLQRRDFASKLLLILLIPGIGQVIYTLEVMKDFKNYLWPRLEEDSTLDLDFKKVKARPKSFYARIVSLPLLAIVVYIIFQYLNSFAFFVIIGGDDGDNLSEISTALYVFLFIQFVILPILIVLTILIAPAFYIYHKHIILSQFIELRYGQNSHHSGYPSINPSIFRVRMKPLVFLGIACASVISYVVAYFILFNTFALQATFIAVVIGILLWLISVVVWLVYEKMWHETMYDLIGFEYESSMKRSHSKQSQF